MFITSLKRIVRTGFVNFWRNGFLSFAAIVVITLSLCAFGGLIFGSAFGRALLTDVKDKVDVNVYFTLTAQQPDILAVVQDISKLPEVASTTYMSSDQVLANFKTKWQDNAYIMQGLDEIGSNPFPAMLTIKAKDPGQYAGIAHFLQTKNPQDASGVPLIEKVNYEQNKLVIDRLGRIIPAAEKAGSVIALILILVAVIVVWNTIRLIIFTERDEISVMKLVGASNTYIRGPLVVSGVMYGLVSAVITLIGMAAFSYWSTALIFRFAGIQIAADFSVVVNIFSQYFMQNFGEIFLIIVGAGIILGGVSSYIAARKYLKI